MISDRYLGEISHFSRDIRLLYLWYPADIRDILISGVQFSCKVLPLGKDNIFVNKLGREGVPMINDDESSVMCYSSLERKERKRMEAVGQKKDNLSKCIVGSLKNEVVKKNVGSTFLC